MIRARILLTGAIALFFFSCSKDKSAEKPDNSTGLQTFQPVAGGSTWHYKDATGTDRGFTLTATGRDTLIAGRTYSVFNNKLDTSSTVVEAFLAQENNDYYMRSLLAALGNAPILYFKDSTDVQSTWNQEVTIDQPPVGALDCTVTFTLASTNATQQVNGVAYKNTSEVDLKITAGGGSLPVGTGTMLVSRGVGIVALSIKAGLSTTINYVLDSYSIKK